MPPKKKIRVSEASPREKEITNAEIARCLEMGREIVGRVEVLEPDHGLTVYFLVSTKSDTKQSLW
jgi:hypothetical protein